jgi:small-conductance mechanosensitive channel
MPIFSYTLFESEYAHITVGGVLWLLAIAVAARIARRKFTIYTSRKLRSLDAFDKEKEKILIRAGRAAILFIAIFSAVYALGLGPLISLVLNYELFKVDKVVLTPGKVLIFILILFITRLLSRLVRVLLRKNFSNKTWVDESKEYTIFKLTKYGLYGLAILVGLTSIGLDIKLILGGIGALLVGIGFGLQHLFYDIISGLIILFEGPVKVGDVIEVNGLVARVQQIDIRTSKVLTRDGKYIIIPNSNLVGEKVVNWSHGSELTRFQVNVRVKYGTDTSLVRDILYNAALKHPDVSKNREIIVRFEDFGESGLHFSVFFWARKTWVIETLQSEIRFDIDQQFRYNGLQVPVPQREVRVSPGTESGLSNQAV